MFYQLVFVISLIITKPKIGLRKGKSLNRFRNFKALFDLKIWQMIIFVQIQNHEQKSNFNDIGRLGEIT
jgi:hypothetical protein